MKHRGWISLILAVLGAAPGFYLGLLDLSQGYLLLALPAFFLAPLFGGYAMYNLLRGYSEKIRSTMIVLAIMAPFAVFALCPGAAQWTVGFGVNFLLTKQPAAMQTWAIATLDAYRQGKIAVDTNAEYWAAGTEKLPESEIPERFRVMWRETPSIGIATMDQNGWLIDPKQPLTGTTTTTNCIAISWYITGILLGNTDFTPTWNPWFMHRIGPGMYAFSGMK